MRPKQGSLYWYSLSVSINAGVSFVADVAAVVKADPNLLDPVNGSWMSLNASSAGERSITLAVFIMCANLAGIIGNQLFRSEDAPLYRTGWTVILALVSFAFLASLVANIQ